MNSEGNIPTDAHDLIIADAPSTYFDESPRVNTKPINLFALFKDIVARGGYDKVSAEKLLWRKIGQEYNLGQSNAAAYAFALKTTYYRYLA